MNGEAVRAWAEAATPSQKAAIATLREAQHLNVDSTPGKPLEPVDVQAHVRTALLDAIAQGGSSPALGTPLTTAQLTRLLDGLREGEAGVKHGLSEKINFEVALLKAVEASRARAIDSLIKEIATMAESLPADGSKKND